MYALLNNNEEKVKEVYKREKIINNLEQEITDYLVLLSSHELPEKDSKILSATFHVINDIERIGDHAENVADLASQRINRNLSYSSDAMEELYEIYNYTVNALEISIESYANRDVEKARSIRAIESRINSSQKKFRDKHIKRLYDGKCNAYAGAIFLDLISNFERIGDHSTNIAESVIENYSA